MNNKFSNLKENTDNIIIYLIAEKNKILYTIFVRSVRIETIETVGQSENRGH